MAEKKFLDKMNNPIPQKQSLMFSDFGKDSEKEKSILPNGEWNVERLIGGSNIENDAEREFVKIRHENNKWFYIIDNGEKKETDWSYVKILVGKNYNSLIKDKNFKLLAEHYEKET